MEEEFLKLINENKTRLVRLCTFYERNPDTRKDLYQEIVFQVWRSFRSFKGKADINTWFYRIAINTAISYKRKTRKDELNKSLEGFYKMKGNNDIEKETEDNELLMKLYEAIENINTMEKSIILLYLEGFTYKEIAGITGFTENNIGVKMNRIRNNLKKLIEV